jgi:1-acyl-sn-glycerol-3-phosphate acyltransferase
VATVAKSRAEQRWRDQVDHRIVKAVRPLASALRRFHRSRIDGVANLPAGGALLVGNHGLIGYETVVFFEELLRETGRMPLGLADRWFFKVPGLREALVRLGGMYGSPDNAHRALTRGDLVVCYPGGAREVLKRRSEQRYRLLWENAKGFARSALRAKVPIVPFAAAGVDDTYDIVSRMRGTGELLMGHAKYDLPVVWGHGPLPRRVPFWFRVGAPIAIPDASPDDEDAIDALHKETWTQTQALLDQLVTEWRCAF